MFDSLVQQRLGKSRYKNPTIPIGEALLAGLIIDWHLAEYDSVEPVVDYQPSYAYAA